MPKYLVEISNVKGVFYSQAVEANGPSEAESKVEKVAKELNPNKWKAGHIKTSVSNFTGDIPKQPKKAKA